MARRQEKGTHQTGRLPKEIAPYYPDGRTRTVIDAVRPQVDGGRFAAKHIVSRPLRIEASVFADGHDHVAAELSYRYSNTSRPTRWRKVRMESLPNDLHIAHFTPDRLGSWQFSIDAWIDHPSTWTASIAKKSAARVDFELDARSLAAACAQAGRNAETAGDSDRSRILRTAADVLSSETHTPAEKASCAADEQLDDALFCYAERNYVTTLPQPMPVRVDRARAGFSAWYELFPRSAGESGSVHGTFDDVIKRLPYIREMGFDIVYLPPIHPIGTVNRKGRNNSLKPAARDPGSPWAIGNSQGGHTAIHPELGDEDSFARLVSAAGEKGLEIALDIAFQCAPDHPWVSEHPEWFTTRPDGSIAFAENPPKKYEDIFPLNFESSDWWGLWQALRDVFLVWMDRGVKVFRVDNPHTKAFAFWEWCLADLKSRDPELIFLAEAFARPNIMYRLAKIGFTHGYTYFTWRTEPFEFRDYLTELTGPPVSDFFRPNFWPNTPDILHETLQTGGRPMFIIRFILAATLSSNYGIYGPAFELQESTPRSSGSEEYLHSEKYEIREWDLDAPHSLARLIAAINQLRNAHPAMQQTNNVRFHTTDNSRLLCYSKVDADRGDLVLVIVNFDVEHAQSGWVEFSRAGVGLSEPGPIYLTDALTGERFSWDESWNYVMLNPEKMPAHVFSVEIPGFTRTRSTQ